MIKTSHLLIRVLAASLILFSKTAFPAVIGVKDTSTSALTTTDVKSGFTAEAVGDLDPTYGTGGKVTTAFSVAAFVGGAAVQPDGKLVVAGGADSLIIARYTLSGSLDSTFGASHNGMQVSPFTVLPRAVAVQPDGKIIVAGKGDGSLPVSFALFRLNPDGSTDSTFSGGLVVINFPAESGIYDIALQPDGKIVVGGEVSFSNSFAFARLNANGSIDTTFGTAGTNMVNMGGPATPFAIALQSDLKVVAVGVVANDFATMRIGSDGFVDQPFGNAGKIITSFSPSQDVANDVVVQPDGKIVVAGYGSFGPGSSPQGVVVRYTSTGTPDGSFGLGGVVTITGDANRSKSLALQANGKIVVAGHVLKTAAFQTDFLVRRLNTDGSPDGSFATAGTTLTDFGAEDTPTSLVLQPDGKLIAAGQTVNHSTNPVTGGFALARYLLAPVDEPVLQTQPFSNHAVAIDSVTYVHEPFSIINNNNFSADHRTRIILFAANLTLANGEPASAVTVQAEDSAGVHNLPVEFVVKMPGVDLLTQVVVKLPDDLAKGNALVSISFHGNTSNKAFIVIQ